MKSSIFALALFAGTIGVTQSSQAGSERRGDHGDYDHRMAMPIQGRMRRDRDSDQRDLRLSGRVSSVLDIIPRLSGLQKLLHLDLRLRNGQVGSARERPLNNRNG
jgi:hypothetical protein